MVNITILSGVARDEATQLDRDPDPRFCHTSPFAHSVLASAQRFTTSLDSCLDRFLLHLSIPIEFYLNVLLRP
jgi:hypothetical protein